MARTFGFELELISSLSRQDLAEEIRDAVRQFGHTVHVGNFYRSTDGSNRTCWMIKTDGTIRPEPPSYPEGVEIASPVLDDTSFPVIKAVCDAIAPYVKVNTSCGFHVHHKINAWEMKQIAGGWSKIEDVIYLCIPPSRRTNRFCKKLGPTSQNGRFARYHDRYYGANFESFWMRGTVEFRCAAGTYEYDKIVNWVLVTRDIIVASLTKEVSYCADIYDVINVLSERKATLRYMPSKKTISLLENCNPLSSDEAVYRTMLRDANPNISQNNLDYQVENYILYKEMVDMIDSLNKNSHLTWLKARYRKFSRR